MRKMNIALFIFILALSFTKGAAARSHDCFSGKHADFQHIDACLENEEARTEKEMQQALLEQEQLARAYEPVSVGQRKRLAKSQDAFLQYRKAECEYQSKLLDTRNLHEDTAQHQSEEIRLSCLIGLTQQRIVLLQEQKGR